MKIQARGKRVRLIVTLLLLGFFGLYLYGHLSDFEPLLRINPIYVAIVALLNVLSVFINGLFIQAILSPFKKTISIREGFLISVISSVGNFFAPAGTGFGFRAIYLKRKHGLSYSDFITTLSGNYVIAFLVTAAAGLVALVGLRGNPGLDYWILAAVFTGLFLADLSLVLFKIPDGWLKGLRRLGVSKKILVVVSNIFNGWNSIVRDGVLISRLLLLTVGGYLVSMAISVSILTALHFPVGLWAVLLFTALGSLSLFINITPANLGIKEAVYLFSAGVLGLNAPQILSYAIIERLIRVSVLMLGWLISYSLGIRAKKYIEDLDQAQT